LALREEKIMSPKDVGDTVALTGAFGSVLGYLPEIAAILAIIWTLIRIYEWARVRIFKVDKQETFK
jgi:hypothetical protein